MQNACFYQFIMHIFVKQNRNEMTEKQFKELLFNLKHYEDLEFSSKTKDYYLLFILNIDAGLIELNSLEKRIKGIWDYCDYGFTKDQEKQLYKSAFELKKESDYQTKYNEIWN